MMVTKDGMRVEVKNVDNEHYVDNAQSLVTKAWNLSSWPGYKSRLWNKEAAAEEEKKAAKARKPLVIFSPFFNQFSR